MSEQTEKYPASTPLPKIIEALESRIARLKKRIEELERPTEQETAEEIEEQRANALAQKKRERIEREKESAENDIRHARASAIRAIVKLLPKAIRQANAGKPALLRLILRSTK